MQSLFTKLVFNFLSFRLPNLALIKKFVEIQFLSFRRQKARL